MSQTVSTLEFLRLLASGSPTDGVTTHLRYPPDIWATLGLRLVEVEVAFAKVALDADPGKHGNQQGTVHGGVVCELADAAIGTAHSTAIAADESFTSVDLKVNFFRPTWRSRLVATARRVNAGRTLSYYVCDVLNEDGKLVATVSSTVMTLRGDQARGR